MKYHVNQQKTTSRKTVMALGLPIQGSKSRHAKEIIDNLPNGNRFVDLFGGGGAMSHAAILSKKFNHVFYNEIDKNLCTFLTDAIAGKYSPDKFKPIFITREEFHKKKHENAYIRYIWSFGNDGDSYLYGRKTEDEKRIIHNAIVFNEITPEFKALYPTFQGFTKSDINERRLELKKFSIHNNIRLDLHNIESVKKNA